MRETPHPPAAPPCGPRERVPVGGRAPRTGAMRSRKSREWALRGCRAKRPPLPPRGDPKEATCFLS